MFKEIFSNLAKLYTDNLYFVIEIDALEMLHKTI